MPRGIFTQCLCVLLKEPVGIDAVAEALKEFTIRKRQEAAAHWALSGPALALEYRPDANGAALVDIVDQPWPDAMGAGAAAEITEAWSNGHFGPVAYAGSLLRASQQLWGWKEGRDVDLRHTGFLRARTTYILDGGPDAPIYPPGWDTAGELRFLTNVVLALLRLPQALLYFNPSGEVLRDRPAMEAQLALAGDDPIPMPLWINTRIFEMEPAGEMMDTVGNGQLNAIVTAGGVDPLPDIEAIFPAKKYDYQEIQGFLGHVTQYLYESGNVIKDGDTIPGPGDAEWKVTLPDEPITTPTRPTLRLTPADMADVVTGAK